MRFCVIGMLMCIFYHKVIDTNSPSDGLKEVRYIDPMKIKYVRKMKEDKTLQGTVNRIQNSERPELTENPQIEEYYVYEPEKFSEEKYY